MKEERMPASGDWLVMRLREENVPFIDNRPKNGALWFDAEPCPAELLQEFKNHDIHIGYSSAKQQWWTRDCVPVTQEAPQAEAPDPAAVKEHKDGFLHWLRETQGDAVDAYVICSASRTLHQFIISRSICALGLFGIQDMNRLSDVVSRAKGHAEFVQHDRTGDNLWTQTSDAYLKYFGSLIEKASVPAEPELTPIEALLSQLQQPEPEAQLEPALAKLLEDAQYAELREALLEKGVVTLADFRALNLWSFMNGNGLYAIGRRYTIFQQLQQLLSGLDASNVEPPRFRLKTELDSYDGATPAAALLEYCRAMARKYPLGLRALVNRSCGSAGVILKRNRSAPTDLQLQNPSAYIPADLSTESALECAKWICWRCKDPDEPTELEDLQSSKPEPPEEPPAEEGILIADLAARNDYSYTQPVSLRFGKELLPETIWLKLYIDLCALLMRRKPRGMLILVEDESGRGISAHYALERHKNRLRNPQEFAPGCYLEAKLSATEIMRRIHALCQRFDLADQLEIRYRFTRSEPVPPEVQAPPTDVKPADDGACIADLSARRAYSFTQPVSLRFGDETLPETKWSNLYYDLCARLMKARPQEMLRFVEKASKRARSPYFALEQNRQSLRVPKEFAPGCYIEANLSATDIMKRVQELCRYFGIFDQIEIRYRSTREKPSAPEKPVEPPATVEPTKPAVVPSLLRRVEDEVLRADIDGMTLDELHAKFPVATMASLKQVRDESKKLVNMPGDRLIHVESFVNFDRISARLQEILERLLNRNNGYVSASLLYEHARAESDIQMFLNDLGGDSERNLYCVARYLFEKVEQRYVFTGGLHISRAGEGAQTRTLDVILSYARGEDGFFAFAQLEEHMRRLGLSTANLRGQMKLGSEPLFLYYTPEELFLAERLGMDEAWLEQVKRALGRLFASMGDHVVLRGIRENWFEQLPELPGRRSWTPLLLQQVLKFHGERLGARSIQALESQAGSVVHCMIVTPESPVQSFADAVAAHLVDSGIEQRRFEAEELRRVLVNGKLIAGNELLGNLHRALSRDERFAWDIAGEHVNVKIQWQT